MKKYSGDIRQTVTFTDGSKITASRSTLNTLSLALAESAIYKRSIGCEATAKIAERMANEIYTALDQVGHYDEYKEQG